MLPSVLPPCPRHYKITLTLNLCEKFLLISSVKSNSFALKGLPWENPDCQGIKLFLYTFVKSKVILD